ncbi:hypothetical protein [Actinocrispum sp. NPDC049592]|uniref:hypothetical protein n=1 Tax=Actinocrispum sp. NPDC049592 TaxID=3154835 RepID=UPI00342F2029
MRGQPWDGPDLPQWKVVSVHDPKSGDEIMWHTVFVALHATTGVVALAAGSVALRAGRLFTTYLTALVGMTLFLVLALIAEWGEIGTTARVLFAAFAVLAGIMVVRALMARRITPGTVPYVKHVGFTLVSLLDAFLVVTVLNMGAPVWLVVVTGVVIGVAGGVVLRRIEAALAVPA